MENNSCKGRGVDVKKNKIGITVLIVMLTATACSFAETLYTKYNLHYYSRLERGGKETLVASYANFVGDFEGHRFLPVNTAVALGSWRRGFSVQIVETGELIHFEFNSRNMGMSAKEYQKLIFSSEKSSYDDLSKLDKKGIKSASVETGMSKDAVKVAWGYPAKHRTASLEMNRWVYWRNRFAVIAVRFEDGKVAGID